MSTSRRLLPVAWLVPALALAPPAGHLTFAPASGSQVKKTFELVSNFALEDLQLVANGDDVGAMVGDIDLSVRSELTAAIVDLYVDSAGGRPTELHRTFDTLDGLLAISTMSEFGGEDEELPSESDLEGRTVRFLWDDEAGEYRASFEDGEGDGELLDGLEEDMDLRMLLPPGEVSAGESWQVPLDRLASLATPGGDLSIQPDTPDVEELDFVEDLFTDYFDDIGELLEGECTCTFRGMDADQPDLAEIEVELDVEGTIDLSDFLLDLIDTIAEEFGEEVPDISIDLAEVSAELEGEGLLTWNTAAGRVEAFQLSGDTIVTVELSISFEMEDESGTMDFSAELSGDFRETVSVEE